ncbi:MAG: hypothetical protein QM723_18465 [Myxococcaceae bacterium]
MTPIVPRDSSQVDETIDFVLTVALREAQVIEAELMLGEAVVPWFVRVRNTREPREVFAETSGAAFRSLLARVAVRMMGNDGDGRPPLYGGHVRRPLRQGRNIRTAVIHMGNEQASGFWIRIVTGLPTDR